MSTADTPTGTLDELPESIEQTLKTLDIHFEVIRFAVRGDISHTGTFGEEWFVLTDVAIFTVTSFPRSPWECYEPTPNMYWRISSLSTAITTRKAIPNKIVPIIKAQTFLNSFCVFC